MDKLIKKIRLSAKMNQEQFANALGTTVLSINRWENNKTYPNKMAQANLLKFCKKYNIDLFSFIVDELKKEKENSLILYHGSKSGIKGDIAPTSRSKCDFGKGFYLGTEPSQPLTLICDEENPVFYTVEIDITELKVLTVDISLDWAMLIAYHRGYLEEVKGSKLYEKYSTMSKGYDVIVGYIANDRMYKVMKSFFENEITDVALFNSLSVLELGKQYVAITPKACKQIKILKEKVLSSLELGILKERSYINREEGINSTEEILKKYRREGKYFDEIVGDESE